MSPSPSSTTPNGDFGWATVTVAARPRLAMALEQRREADRYELVAVQHVHVAALAPLARGELDPAAAPEPLRLLGRDDLGPSPASSRSNSSP